MRGLIASEASRARPARRSSTAACPPPWLDWRLGAVGDHGKGEPRGRPERSHRRDGRDGGHPDQRGQHCGQRGGRRRRGDPRPGTPSRCFGPRSTPSWRTLGLPLTTTNATVREAINELKAAQGTLATQSAVHSLGTTRGSLDLSVKAMQTGKADQTTVNKLTETKADRDSVDSLGAVVEGLKTSKADNAAVEALEASVSSLQGM